MPVCLTLQLASLTVCLWEYSVCLDVMWMRHGSGSRRPPFALKKRSMMNGTGLVPTLSAQQTTTVGFVLIPSPTERQFHFQVLFSISYCSHCGQQLQQPPSIILLPEGGAVRMQIRKAGVFSKGLQFSKSLKFLFGLLSTCFVSELQCIPWPLPKCPSDANREYQL